MPLTQRSRCDLTSGPGRLTGPTRRGFLWVGQRAARPFPERRPANPRGAASLIWSKVANARATGKLQSDHKGKGPGTTLTGASLEGCSKRNNYHTEGEINFVAWWEGASNTRELCLGGQGEQFCTARRPYFG